MSDVDFKDFLESFLERPILPAQEAMIVALMFDGTINKNGAIELFKHIRNHNLNKYNEIMNMNQEDILRLMDEYGIQYNEAEQEELQ